MTRRAFSFGSEQEGKNNESQGRFLANASRTTRNGTVELTFSTQPPRRIPPPRHPIPNPTPNLTPTLTLLPTTQRNLQLLTQHLRLEPLQILQPRRLLHIRIPEPSRESLHVISSLVVVVVRLVGVRGGGGGRRSVLILESLRSKSLILEGLVELTTCLDSETIVGLRAVGEGVGGGGTVEAESEKEEDEKGESRQSESGKERKGMKVRRVEIE